MREQRRRETQHSWIRSTQSSTSQRVRVERSVMNMRWDRLRHNPWEQQQRTQPSNAVTSLHLYLDKTKPSELCWQRESLALEKQSLCRSSSWTGLKGKRIRTSSSYFHCLSEKSIQWSTKHSVFQIFFMSFSPKLKTWKYPVMNIKCCSSLMVWMSVDCLWTLRVKWNCVIYLNQPQWTCCWWTWLWGICFPLLSSGSPPDQQQLISSPLSVSIEWQRYEASMSHRRRNTSGRESVIRVWPIKSSHTWSHQGASTSCATSQFSAGSQPLFWRRCWVEQRVERFPRLSLKCTLTSWSFRPTSNARRTM